MRLSKSLFALRVWAGYNTENMWRSLMLSQTDISLATRLRNLRVKMGRAATQKETAKDIGISPSVLAGYEGTTENSYRQPNLEMLCKLADFYNVSTDYLLGRDAYATQGQKTICEITGLSEVAAEYLTSFMNDGSTNKALSMLIESVYFADLLTELDMYVNGEIEPRIIERDVMLEGKVRKVKITSMSREKFRFAQFVATSIELAKQLRDDYIKRAQEECMK
jgi:transcriptional regulator with XRE-family HTH domain